MQHAVVRELLWDAQASPTRDVREAGPAHQRAEDPYGLARGLAWGLLFSVPLWSAVFALATR